MREWLRQGLLMLLVALLLVPPTLAQTPARGAGITLVGARLWPARDYTRLTLEAKAPLHWTLFSIESPERLVLDLDGVEPGPATDALAGRVRTDDPWVRTIRVGRFRPGTLRIVLDLKAPVKASASLLEPVGDYGFRLVLDIYPAEPVDPLLALLQDSARQKGSDASAAAGLSPLREDAAAAPPGGDAGQAELPAKGERAGKAESADKSERAGPVETPDKTPRAVKAETADRTERTGKAETADKTERPGKAETADKTERPGRAETADKTERAGRAEATDKAPAPTPVPDATGSNGEGRGAASASADRRDGSERKDGRRKLPLERQITIAIDAGHGGEDPGAHGDGGTLEKNVTLAIAERIKEHIDDEPNLRGVLVRDGDYFIPLQGRTAKARQMRADLFVSVHADAFINRDARGSSVFALSERGATSVAARWLANRENQADLIGGVNINAHDPYLAQTLFDLSQTATIHDSLRLGRIVLRELGALNPLHKGDVEQAGFAVLKSPDIPSILVETAFITNPEEERRLGDARYQDRIAATIVRGIRRYLQANPPAGKPRLSARGTAP